MLKCFFRIRAHLALLLVSSSVFAASTDRFSFAVSVGGTSVLATSAAVDASGNTLVTGSFQGTVDFDPGTGSASLSSGGTQAAFVAKYDSAGALVWARAFTQSASTSGQGNSVAVSSTGDVYIAGSFAGTMDADPGAGTVNLVSAGGNDAFLIKLNSSGNYVWANRWGSTGADSANGVAVDGSGNAAVAGSFSGTVDLDPGAGTVSRTSAGGTDASIQKFTSAGALSFAYSFGSSVSDTAISAAFDSTGAIFLGGTFQSTVDFDPSVGTANLTSNGGLDVFVLKLNSTGGFAWARSFGTGFSETIGALASDGTNVAVAGGFQGTIDFDPGTGTFNLASAGLSDAYVLKLDGSGNFAWAANFGAVNSDSCLNCAADSAGNIYIAGQFQNTVDFAPGSGVVNLTSNGGYDGFIVKLDASGLYQFAEKIGGIGYDGVFALGSNAAGTISIAGRYAGPATIGSFTLAQIGSVSMFVAQAPASTAPAAPSTPDLQAASDSGILNTDNITSAASPVFNIASAASANTVKLLRGGGVVATRTGPGALTDPAPAQGTYAYTAIQSNGTTDSEPSAALIVVIDRTAPTTPAAPQLNPSDDAGTIGDGITNVTQPNLAGTAEAGATVQILDSANVVRGSSAVNADGSYLVQFSSALANGTYAFRVRAIDVAGNVSAPSAALTLTITSNPPGGTPRFIYAAGIGGTSVQAIGTTVDEAGNSIVTGTFQGTVDFDPSSSSTFNLTAGGSQDAFVAKYSSTGAFVWARSFAQAAATSGQSNSVAVNLAGDVYVAGSFSGTLDADPGVGTFSLVSAGGTDAYLIKLNASGNFVFGLRWGSTGADSATGVAVDSAGNAIVSGSFTGTVDLDPGTGTLNKTSAGATDCSIQKFNASGALLWAVSLGGTIADAANSVAVDSTGAVFAGGTFQGTVDFDPGAGTANLTSAGGPDGFILKLNSSGGYVWARRFGNSFAESLTGICSDGSNVAAVGSFQGTLDFDPGAGTFNLTSAGLNDGYVVKLNSSGSFAWAANFGAVNSDFGVASTADSLGNIYVAGSFQNTVDFAPGAASVTLSSFGNYDAYVVKLDASGNYQYAEHPGGLGYDSSFALGCNSAGTVGIAGRYQGPAAFGPAITLQQVGTISMFVGQIGIPSTPAPTFTVSGTISGATLDGVVVSDGTRTATSDASGNFTLSGVPNGSYTLTASKPGYVFAPPWLGVTVAGANLTGKNFASQLVLTIASGPTANPAPAVAGQTVNFTCAASGGGGLLSWSWAFGDGSISNAGAAVSHVFAAAGTYTIVVTASANGQTATGSVILTVNTAPGDGSGGGTDGGGARPPGNTDPDGDFDNDGVINSSDTDDDNDGYSDDEEAALGTHPFDPNSHPIGQKSFLVGKLQGSVKFGLNGKDSVLLKGAIPDVPAGFTPTGVTMGINVSGAQALFTLSSKGKAKSNEGQIALKIKGKRNPATKTVAFLGGILPFQVKLMHGTFSDDFLLILDQAKPQKNVPATLAVTITMNGTPYIATVTVQASNSNKSGKFIKK